MTLLIAIYDRFVTALAVIVAILIAAAMVLVTTDVVARYFFNSPIGWVLEYTEYILVYTPFLGMAWLVRRAEGHVRIDVIVSLLAWRTQQTVYALTSYVTAAVCGVAGYFSIVTIADHIARGVMTGGIYPIPKFLVLAPIVIGLTLTTIEFVRLGTRHWAERQNPA